MNEIKADIWIGRDIPAIYRNGLEYFLISVNDELFLIENKCAHRGGPLKLGSVKEGCYLICPWHQSHVSIEHLLQLPTTIALREERVLKISETISQTTSQTTSRTISGTEVL